MGSWGFESCSNDDCWDYLYCADIHKITQKEANKSIKNAFFVLKKSKIETWNKQALLGMVIWTLRHGLKVKKEYLNKAFQFAVDLKNDEEYIKTWKDTQKRTDNLKKEMDDIDNAIKNNGKGKIEHISGLFENIIKGTEQEKDPKTVLKEICNAIKNDNGWGFISTKTRKMILDISE